MRTQTGHTDSSCPFAVRHERRQSRLKAPIILQLTLPDDCDAESQRFHGEFLALVASPIGRDLLVPPVMIGTRKACAGTSFMAVPKAAMNENTPPLSLVRHVGTAREIGRARAKAKAETMQKAANRSFWLSIALFDGLHSSRRIWGGMPSRRH